MKMEKYGDPERKAVEFYVVSIHDVYKHADKWTAYVVASNSYGTAMKTLEFDTRQEAETCKGVHFLVNV